MVLIGRPWIHKALAISRKRKGVLSQNSKISGKGPKEKHAVPPSPSPLRNSSVTPGPDSPDNRNAKPVATNPESFRSF